MRIHSLPPSSMPSPSHRTVSPVVNEESSYKSQASPRYWRIEPVLQSSKAIASYQSAASTTSKDAPSPEIDMYA